MDGRKELNVDGPKLLKAGDLGVWPKGSQNSNDPPV